jgi:pimeloyl-ACP methyl ester carboxylesterase
MAHLVMLHGGVIPGEMFGAPLAEMARTHRVIAPHARGHGLSKDTTPANRGRTKPSRTTLPRCWGGSASRRRV